MEGVVFFVLLDVEFVGFIREDLVVLLDVYVYILLVGWGYDCWFDKFFILIVFFNGKLGFSVEYFWVDCFILGYMWEFILVIECF